MLTEFNLKQEEIAERVSKSRTAVTNSMRLLKLDERVQQMVIEGMLSTGHARALLAIEDNDLQFQMATKIYNEKLSVRDVEKLVKNLGKKKPGKERRKCTAGSCFSGSGRKNEGCTGYKSFHKQKK